MNKDTKIEPIGEVTLYDNPKRFYVYSKQQLEKIEELESSSDLIALSKVILLVYVLPLLVATVGMTFFSGSCP